MEGWWRFPPLVWEAITLKLFNSHVLLSNTDIASLDNGFEERLLRRTGKSVSHGQPSSSEAHWPAWKAQRCLFPHSSLFVSHLFPLLPSDSFVFPYFDLFSLYRIFHFFWALPSSRGLNHPAEPCPHIQSCDCFIPSLCPLIFKVAALISLQSSACIKFHLLC